MSRISPTLAAALCAVALAGCASNPKVSMTYYLAETAMKVKVVRTVACDANDYPIVATTVTPTVTHSAHRDASRTVEIAKFDSGLANNDVKFEFYEDGRLKGVNATATGQGEAIFKSLLTLATPFFGLDGGSKTFPTECKFVKDHGGGKPLSLTYFGDVRLEAGLGPQSIRPEDASLFYQTKLDAALGDVCAMVDAIDTSAAPVSGGTDTVGVMLKARQPAAAKVRVNAGIGAASCGGDKVWEGAVPVAQKGVEYSLPVAKAQPFGKRVFAVAFAESGALTTVQYASETGAPALLGVAKDAASALDVTAAEKAAELKAEADVIAQQQRLVGCLADPATCK